MAELLSNLIYHFREKPCLWDSNCRSYRDRYARENAIQQISQDMNLTADEVKTKWRSTRNLYLRKKKIYEDELMKSANGTGEYIEPPSWPFYKSMEFINVNLKRHSSSMMQENPTDFLHFECSTESIDNNILQNGHVNHGIKKEPESYLDDLSILSEESPFKKKFVGNRDILSPSILDKAYAQYDDKNALRQDAFESLKLMAAPTSTRRFHGNGTFRKSSAGAHHPNASNGQHANGLANHRRYQSIADYIAMALDGMPETMALETLNSVTKIVIDAQLIVAKHRHSADAAKNKTSPASSSSSSTASGIKSATTTSPVNGVQTTNTNTNKVDELTQDALIVLSELTPVASGNSAASVMGVSAVVDPSVGVVQGVASSAAVALELSSSTTSNSSSSSSSQQQLPSSSSSSSQLHLGPSVVRSDNVVSDTANVTMGTRD